MGDRFLQRGDVCVQGRREQQGAAEQDADTRRSTGHESSTWSPFWLLADLCVVWDASQAPLGSTNMLIGLQSGSGDTTIRAIALQDAPEGGTCHP